MFKIHQTRYGAYGIVLKEGEGPKASEILLTQKTAGPYKGKWDLPGGGIEFGETPEMTLKRELLEETALSTNSIELLTAVSSLVEYEDLGKSYIFHHVGILYKVLEANKNPSLIPEEVELWVSLENAPREELTPFALQAVDLMNALCVRS